MTVSPYTACNTIAATKLHTLMEELLPETIFRIQIADGMTTRQISDSLILAFPDLIRDTHTPETLHAPGVLLQHDPVGAPYLSDRQDSLFNYHLSLSDEHGIAGGILVKSSLLTGIGFDLSCILTNWTPDMDLAFFYPEELNYIHSFPEKEHARIRSLLFSCKEAAVKSLADLIRPEILKNETAYDQIDLRQFQITVMDIHHIAIQPIDAAAKLLGTTHCMSGIYCFFPEQKMYGTIAILK